MRFLQDLTVEDVEQFVPKLLKSLHIEALLHGNLTEDQAIRMVKLVEEK